MENQLATTRASRLASLTASLQDWKASAGLSLELSIQERRLLSAFADARKQIVVWQGGEFCPVLLQPIFAVGKSDELEIFVVDPDAGSIFLFKLHPNGLSGKLIRVSQAD